MDVAIAGGHGKIARRLARLLVARGDRVRGMIRDPGQADDLREDGSEPVACDLESATAGEIASAIEGADAVVFAAGAGPGSGAERKWSLDRDGAVRLLEAAVSADVDRYLMVSTIGAEHPPDDDEVFSVYLRAKAEADRAVIESDRAWTIVRPVRLTDDPGSGAVSITAEPVPGTVSRDDVASVLAATLDEPRASGSILYLRSGPEPIEEALAAHLAG
jgi:uncharacterized protein YbjT (DUF2867 family)